MLTCITRCLLLVLIINTYKAKQPFDPNSGKHIHAIVGKFYDIYFYEHNQTILNDIKLINNNHSIIQQNLSNTDDVPEIRFDLSWDFKFYGHLHNWITISPNGFLTTHPVTCWSFCNWWYESGDYRRYIAPLMADFNPSKYTESLIFYYIDNDEKSINVQWHNVTLWQPTNSSFLGYKYDFQVKLKSDGTIIFYYFNIPKSPSQVRIPFYTAENYSVIIGLEDAAYKHLNDGLYSLYPYHPVNINETNMLSHHTIVFKPRQTCIDQTDCNQCQRLANNSTWECGWCPKLGLCSDGLGREIYEYTSSDYCTWDEMIDDLVSETCIDYVIDSRVCKENYHVLAKHPTEMVQIGRSRFYSGVIISLDSDTNAYLISYDNESMLQSMVQYSWVHPCSTVSYDYSSYELPPHCTPHCNSIPTHEDKNEKTKNILRTIGIAIAVLVVLCAILQFFFYRGRTLRRQMADSENIVVNQATRRGIQIGDDDEEEFDLNRDNNNVLNSYNFDRTMSSDGNVNNRLSVPIISPAATSETDNKFANNNNNIASSVDMVDVGIEEAVLGEVQLQIDNIVAIEGDSSSSSDGDEDEYNINSKTKGQQWDMTPLT